MLHLSITDKECNSNSGKRKRLSNVTPTSEWTIPWINIFWDQTKFAKAMKVSLAKVYWYTIATSLWFSEFQCTVCMQEYTNTTLSLILIACDYYLHFNQQYRVQWKYRNYIIMVVFICCFFVVSMNDNWSRIWKHRQQFLILVGITTFFTNFLC